MHIYIYIYTEYTVYIYIYILELHTSPEKENTGLFDGLFDSACQVDVEYVTPGIVYLVKQHLKLGTANGSYIYIYTYIYIYMHIGVNYNFLTATEAWNNG